MSAERDGYRASGVLDIARTIRTTAANSLKYNRDGWWNADPAGAEVKRILEQLVIDLEPYRRRGKTRV